MSGPEDLDLDAAPEPLPALTAARVADEQELAQAVDALIGADPEARERAAELALYVAGLREAVDPDTWRLALRIEELCVARWADLVVKIASWAWWEGRRHASEPEDEG